VQAETNINRAARTGCGRLLEAARCGFRRLHVRETLECVRRSHSWPAVIATNLNPLHRRCIRTTLTKPQINWKPEYIKIVISPLSVWPTGINKSCYQVKHVSSVQVGWQEGHPACKNISHQQFPQSLFLGDFLGPVLTWNEFWKISKTKGERNIL